MTACCSLLLYQPCRETAREVKQRESLFSLGPSLVGPSSVGIKPTAKKAAALWAEEFWRGVFRPCLPPGGRLPFPAGCFIHPVNLRSLSRYSLSTPEVAFGLKFSRGRGLDAAER